VSNAINRDPAALFPRFAATHGKFLEAWNRNNPKTPIAMFEGLRTFERSDYLYSMGRTIPSNSPCKHAGIVRPLGSCHEHPLGATVTNAKGGDSWHNFGLSADNVFDADPNKVGPQWMWEGPYQKLGALGQAMGLEWAGAWRTFREQAHFQMTFGLQLNEARELYRRGGLPAVWAAL
jgi:peptidoglycan LD-endopeptidase CwlK